MHVPLTDQKLNLLLIHIYILYIVSIKYQSADQRLCFRNIVKIRNFKVLAISCGCTAWFVSNLVGNPEVRFSRDKAQI